MNKLLRFVRSDDFTGPLFIACILLVFYILGVALNPHY